MSGPYAVDAQLRDTLAYLKAVMTEDTLAQRVIADHGQLDLIADLMARTLIGSMHDAGSDPRAWVDRMFAAADRQQFPPPASSDEPEAGPTDVDPKGD